MTALLDDLRQVSRFLRANGGLVAVSVLSLGLGLGVNLTLFATIQGVFFYQPTVAAASRVVSVQPGNSNQWSYLNYRDLRDSGIFEAVAGYRRVPLTLRDRNAPEPLSGIAVTANFFDFLGVPMAAGRAFAEAEATPERDPRAAVLSDGFWNRRFGRDPAVIGREVTINGESFVISGVLTAVRPVTMLQEPDVYVPLSRLVLPTVNDRSNGNALAVLGRLRSGVARAQALTALNALDVRLEQAYLADNEGMGRPGRVLPLRGGDLAGSPEQLIVPAILLAVFGLVLLSACANVAGLLLARAATRQREIAVRVSLGARRTHIARLLLAESFSLAVLGTLAGASFSTWLVRLLNTLSFPNVEPVDLELGPSLSLGAYGLAMLGATGLLCVIAPALRTTRRSITAVMYGGDSQTSTGRLRLRHAFVVGQVTACLILLMLSSLMLRSLMHVSTMDPGFDVEHGLVASVGIDPLRSAADGGLSLAERLVERVQTIVGVESVSFANMVPLGTDRSATRLQIIGTPRDQFGPRAYINSVSPQYFATLGVPFVGGRDFSAAERQGSPPVAIVTESFQRAYFQDGSAIGRQVRRVETEPYFEIVGVVRDHMLGSYGDVSTPIFYTSYLQQPRVSTQVRPIVMNVRTSGSSSALIAGVRTAIASVDPTVIADVRTFRDATSSELSLRRFGSELLTAAGALGLLLAMIGLYGMMAYVVATRTPEIGVRMALGATQRGVLASVLGQGMKLVGVGLAIGTLISLAVAQLARGLLAGLSPTDPAAFGGAAAVLLLVGAAACYWPARRAAAVDPIVALRRL
jgi:putative ABC transport system permease protein